MKRQFLLGIDIGTQSTRVAILDCFGNVVESFSTLQEMETPKPGWGTQDPDMWWQHVVTNIQKAFQKGSVQPGEILGIGVSGQMHATIPVGKNGELLDHQVQLYCDKRTAELAETFKSEPDFEFIANIVGNPPVASWFGFKVQWLKLNAPDLYKNTWKFVPSPGYINYRLTGELTTEWTDASGSYLMDIHTKDWSPEMVGRLCIDIDKLPEIRESSEVVGRVTKEAATLTGLLEGTPVVAGAGDMLCMLIGSGLTKPGQAADITGTASILSVYVDKPVIDSRLMNLHHALPGWIPFGLIDTGGGSLKWFKDELCKAEVAQATAAHQEVYDILNADAGSVDTGSEGLLFYPYLMGERSFGTPFARGVFFGITPRTTTGTMVRSIMEGVTFEMRRTLEVIESAGNRVNEIFTIGGGANSDLWSQIKADIYNKPVSTFESSEGGILGSAILAGVGVGVYEDANQGAENCCRIQKTFQPDSSLQDRYNYLFDLFKEVHDTLQKPFESLAGMP